MIYAEKIIYPTCILLPMVVFVGNYTCRNQLNIATNFHDRKCFYENKKQERCLSSTMHKTAGLRCYSYLSRDMTKPIK